MSMKLRALNVWLCVVVLFGVAGCKVSVNPLDSETSLNADQARYTVTLKSQWSRADFPIGYPAAGYFSPMVMVNHNNQISIWSLDGEPSNGVQSLAESGNVSLLDVELTRAKNQGYVASAFSLPRVDAVDSINTNTIIQRSANFVVSENYPYVSAISKITPSSDWIVGVHDVNLFEGNQWAKEKSFDLYVYDVGTQLGDSFTTFSTPGGTRNIERLTQSTVGFKNGVRQGSGKFVARLTFKR